MSRLASIVFVFAVSFVLADFLATFFAHWYFAHNHWLKTGLLLLLTWPAYSMFTNGTQPRLWRAAGWYWLALYAGGLLISGSWTLRDMGFTAVLDLEAGFIWFPIFVLLAADLQRRIAAARSLRRERADLRRSLNFGRRLRRINAQPVVARGEWLREHLRSSGMSAVLLVLTIGGLLCQAGTALAQDADPDIEPDIKVDRHTEFKDETLRRWPTMPDISGLYPEPAASRIRETWYIEIDNEIDGEIRISAPDFSGVVGHVLAPVANFNKEGFTASGWAESGSCTASAVNAIHLKVKHNYETGRATIFSLVPIEFTTFDPKTYKSYYNQSSTLFTDITAGSEIFGGRWAPLVGSPIETLQADGSWQQISEKYVPAVGDRMRLVVSRRVYNPEWIEFENGFGGIIWIKELGMDPYPIGQVLKPVAGVGRFLGTQYAERGRIRAAHPGVIDISTSPYDVIGGFQIIPRDHAMSPEMTFARVKSQWMVVGPLWALDPSWEGLPPLFTDYLYPAFTPAFNDDGSVNEEVQGAAVFLDRFTVRARYSDSANPDQYELLQEMVNLDHDALKNMTHLRIYFPRG
jgi:hypothetical protein